MKSDDDDDEPDEYLIVRANGEVGDYATFRAIINITISGGPPGGGPGVGPIGMLRHIYTCTVCLLSTLGTVVLSGGWVVVHESQSLLIPPPHVVYRKSLYKHMKGHHGITS